jgi:hypothetical protein
VRLNEAVLPLGVPWNGIGEDAAALEGAIQRLAPDATMTAPGQDALRDAAARAMAIAQGCRDHAAPEVADCAQSIGLALQLIASGEVEPHHAQWQMAAAIQAIRQALDKLAAGESYSPVALAGAQYELETLFPVPGKLLAPSSLVRRLT